MEHMQSCMCMHSTHAHNTCMCPGLPKCAWSTHGQREHTHAEHTTTHGEHTGGQQKAHYPHLVTPQPCTPSPCLGWHTLCAPSSSHHAGLGAARWGSGPHHPRSPATQVQQKSQGPTVPRQPLLPGSRQSGGVQRADPACQGLGIPTGAAWRQVGARRA